MSFIMKKIVLFAAAALMAATASAQKVSSTTYIKEKAQTMWYGRIGMSINNIAGAPSGSKMGSKAGLDVDFGFQKNISHSGLYWGMELGVGSRGASIGDGEDKVSLSAWNIKYSPITLGYKYSLTDDLKLDGHLGGFLSYDFTKNAKWDDGEKWDDQDFDEIDYQDLDAGMQVGAGVWYKRFNLDFTYQRGFTKAAKADASHDLHSSNFMIRLGVAF